MGRAQIGAPPAPYPPATTPCGVSLPRAHQPGPVSRNRGEHAPPHDQSGGGTRSPQGPGAWRSCSLRHSPISRHEDGDASASGVDPLSGLQQPTPVQVVTEQASHRHNPPARGGLHSQRPRYLRSIRRATQSAALPRRCTSPSTTSVTRTASATSNQPDPAQARCDRRRAQPSPHAALAGPRAERHHQPVGHQPRPRPPARPRP